MDIDALLEAARARIAPRVQASGLAAAVADGALVVDIRPIEARSLEGELPGAVVIDRNVLEWRLDPASAHHIDGVAYERPIVVVCNEGYASSLAAATLRDLGLTKATDLDGGFRAWRKAQKIL